MAFVSIAMHILTKGFCDCHDITREVNDAVENSGIDSGIVTVFIPGSTAGLTTIEFEEGAVNDFIDTLEKLVPQDAQYKHNRKLGDGNGFSHVRGALVGPSLAVPFTNGIPQLGQWQQILLIDFDNKPRNRKYLINILGE
mgnify:CR=1 FL=1